ncbi:hypothetical protein ABIF94_005753 [Bradyrhizobium ottawaense]
MRRKLMNWSVYVYFTVAILGIYAEVLAQF